MGDINLNFSSVVLCLQCDIWVDMLMKYFDESFSFIPLESSIEIK